jgi:hypothetical protein
MMGNWNNPAPNRFVANADGSEKRKIPGLRRIPSPRRRPLQSNPAGTWSPDGSRIVCTASDTHSRSPVVVVDIATGRRFPVAEGNEAIWLGRQTLLVESRDKPRTESRDLSSHPHFEPAAGARSVGSPMTARAPLIDGDHKSAVRASTARGELLVARVQPPHPADYLSTGAIAPPTDLPTLVSDLLPHPADGFDWAAAALGAGAATTLVAHGGAVLFTVRRRPGVSPSASSG